MTTSNHTPIATGAAANAATFNAPLSQLDSAVVGLMSSVGSGAGWATTLNAQATLGQKVVPVASTVGAVVGMPIYIGLTSGTHEVGVINTISAGVSVTLVANLASTYASGQPISATPAEVADARGASATLDARLDAQDVAIAARPIPINVWVGPFDPRLIGSPGANPAPNLAMLQSFQVLAPVTVTNIHIWIGAVSAGNIDVGIYSGTPASLTRLGSSGSVAAGTINLPQSIALTASVSLVPGVRYWVALVASGATCQFYQSGTLTSGPIAGIACAKGAAFPLPGAIASATDGWSFNFYCALT